MKTIKMLGRVAVAVAVWPVVVGTLGYLIGTVAALAVGMLAAGYVAHWVQTGSL